MNIKTPFLGQRGGVLLFFDLIMFELTKTKLEVTFCDLQSRHYGIEV